MKFPLLSAAAFSLAILLSGCGHLDLMAPGPADRVLTGTVTYTSGDPLPEDAEVDIRVVDLSRGEEHAEVLGEQTIKNPGPPPIAFRIEYRAEDAAFMRRVNVDARISVGGRLRYTTASAHPVTLGNVNDPHVIEVEPLRQH